MSAIRKSAEHHFLTKITDLRDNNACWHIMRFALSGRIEHDEMMYNPQRVLEKIATQRAEAEKFYEAVLEDSAQFEKQYSYIFTDHDVVVLALVKDAAQEKAFADMYQKHAANLPEKMSSSATLQHEIYKYQKLADEKFLSERRLKAYDVLADTNRIESIPIRRKKRGYPLVQVVEDDRFTASYAANILGKDFELIISRSGEDAIIDYVEHVPDIVFMDIHLPGINGHQALHTIRSMDEDVFAYMLSVDTVADNIRQAKNHGAIGFLKKPFSKERIIKVVKTSPHIMRSMAAAGPLGGQSENAS